MATKVTVIVPVYNVERYIERCVRSLMEQTLDDVEYIFIDDCSTDGSMPLLQRTFAHYPQRQPGIKIVRNERNVGCSLSRKAGVRIATGEYIMHCDSDDWMEPDMLEALYTKACSDDLDIVWCDFFEGDDGHVTRQLSGDTPRDQLLKGLLCRRKRSEVWSHMVRRRLCRADITYADAGDNIAEDYLLMFQLFYYARRFGSVARPLYHYSLKPTSVSVLTSSDGRDKFIAQWAQGVRNLRKIDDFIASHGESNELEPWFRPLKLEIKSQIEGALDHATDCRLWIDCFPEINTKLWTMPQVTLLQKVKAATIFIRLYPLIRAVLKAWRNRQQ